MESGGDLPVNERMRRLAHEFTASERRIMRTLLMHYPAIGLQSAASLAMAAGVSAPTVTRFVSHLGFDGYRGFQQQLTAELAARSASPLTQPTSVTEGTTTTSLREIALDRFSSALQETFTNLSDAEVQCALDLIADTRRRVTSFGGRFSHNLAVYLDSHLRHMRPDTLVHPVAPVHHAGFLADVGRDDVCVVFDVRRYQQDVIDLSSYARERGARIVLVTDPWLSPIAEFADAVLPISVTAPSPFDSLVSGMAMVELLVAGLLPRFGDAARDRMERAEQAAGRIGSGSVTPPGV